MKLLSRSLALVILVACGGTAMTTTGGDGGAPGGGGSTTDTCTVQVQAGDRACVPAEAKAKTALTIEIDATQGCLPCFTALDACAVDVNGTDISVGMRTRTCTPAGDPACPTICAMPSTTCSLPPLEAGTYTVRVSGETMAGFAARQLVVTDTATTTSCALVRPTPAPSTLDTAKYGKSCTVDADCTGVVAAVCKPCACVDAVIATVDAPAFAAERRAAASQCAGPGLELACAGCPDPRVRCALRAGAEVGTCTYGN